MPVKTLPETLMQLYGWPKAAEVIDTYKMGIGDKPVLLQDLAIYCNAAAPIEGADEFERGVEEGKRRVWLHIARMCGLTHADFIPLADGTSKR